MMLRDDNYNEYYYVMESDRNTDLPSVFPEQRKNGGTSRHVGGKLEEKKKQGIVVENPMEVEETESTL